MRVLTLALLALTAPVLGCGDVPTVDVELQDDEALEAQRQARAESARLAATSRMALIEQLGRYGLGIEVEAEDTTVYLRGPVTPDVKAVAASTVRSIPGVEDVIDSTVIPPEGDDTLPEGDPEATLLEASVRAELLAALGADALDLDIGADDGTVAVEGPVDSDAHLELAERSVERMARVDAFTSRIRVAPDA